MWHRDRERPHARLQGLVLEAIGMRLTLGPPLIRASPNKFLPLQQHRRVEQQANRLRQSGQPAVSDLFQECLW